MKIFILLIEYQTFKIVRLEKFSIRIYSYPRKN